MGSPGKLGSNVCFAVEIRESKMFIINLFRSSCTLFWDDITKFWDENFLSFTFLTGKLRKSLLWTNKNLVYLNIKTNFRPIISSRRHEKVYEQIFMIIYWTKNKNIFSINFRCYVGWLIYEKNTKLFIGTLSQVISW